uniref:Uncharacterized protein n=1 Tax=Panagrolaimus sp. PS1159 TaxID=55785 RepID=A0AC35F407_9BILA
MAEEEGISIKSDAAMSISDQPAADSETIVPLSDVMSQHTENKGDDSSDIIESVDIAVNEGNNEQEEETFELKPEFESTELEKPIASKEGETENVDDNASIHSDGQLTTDNEEDEMENFTQNQISNGQNFDNSGQNFNQPLNEYNGF